MKFPPLRGSRRRLRVLLFRRRRWTAVGCVLLACAMFWVVGYPAAVPASAAKRQLPVYCVQREEKVCSLTFDAAWGADDTDELISILTRYQVKATFFLVGQWVDKYPEEVKALYDAGMEIGNHSNVHAHMPTLSLSEITADLTACNDKITAVTGQAPALVRLPYGDYDDNCVSAVRAMGMEAIQWDVDSLDWKGISAGEITKRVLSKVDNGSIILFHNAAEHTPEALPGIIEALLARGYTIVPVSQLLLTGDTVIDVTGRQCPAQQ